MADRWCVAEGIYLPKEVDSKHLNQFRPISLLNIDGKVIFSIIANRIIKFVQSNGCVDETVQKAGIQGIPGCIEHAYAIWNSIQECKVAKDDLSVIWLDLKNAYGSVPQFDSRSYHSVLWQIQDALYNKRLYHRMAKARGWNSSWLYCFCNPIRLGYGNAIALNEL